jgi:hypothetical protein
MDGDLGIPNPVLYSFTSGDHAFFNIDPTTGWITVKTSIDREDSQVLSSLGALEMTVTVSFVSVNVYT